MNQKIGMISRSITEILEDFSKPIPPEYLKTKPTFRKNKRTGKSEKSGEISYAPWGSYVKLLLKYAPGYSWKIRTQYFGDKIIVEGSLIIKASDGEFIYEATGTADPLDNNYGYALYDAESSAIRRACAKAGLGLYLWKSQEIKQQNEAYHQRETTVNYSVNSNGSQRKITEPQAKRLYAIAKKESGLSDDEIKAVLQNSGYSSANDILMIDYDGIVAQLKEAKPTDPKKPWKNWKDDNDAIAWAMDQLPDMHLNKISKEWNALKPVTLPNGKLSKAIAWISRVEDLKVVPF